MKRALLAAALLLTALAAPAAAAGAGKGTSAGAFLRLAPGARGAALGEALGGAADDAYAAWYNPAALGPLERVEAAGAHESRFEGLAYDALILAVPILSWTDSPRRSNAFGTVALSVYGLSANDIERRGLVETDAPSGRFALSDRAYALSYGWSVPGAGLSAGASAKFVDSALDSARATALTFDAGLLWRGETLSLGAGGRNVGGKLRYVAVADPLPRSLYAGVGWRPRPDWLLCAQLEQPAAEALALGFGAERRWTPSAALEAFLRGGYNTGRADAGGLAGASLGFGLGWRSLRFDFAWSPAGPLGDVLKYSLLVRFGESRPAISRARKDWR